MSRRLVLELEGRGHFDQVDAERHDLRHYQIQSQSWLRQNEPTRSSVCGRGVRDSMELNEIAFAVQEYEYMR
jgi:hypothetical protein